MRTLRVFLRKGRDCQRIAVLWLAAQLTENGALATAHRLGTTAIRRRLT
jgi:hypothetical protein